jgi:hypothetical protein
LLSRRTTTSTSTEQSLPTEALVEAPAAVSEPATEEQPDVAGRTGRRRPPVGLRRPALLLAVAVAGGVAVNVLAVGQPDAQAGAADQPVSVADQLGLTSHQSSTTLTNDVVSQRLGELAANRSEREAAQTAAAQSQAAADQAAIDAKAAEEARLAAEAKAAEEARLAAEAAAEAAAEQAAQEKAAAEQAAADRAAAQKTTSAPASTSSSSSSGSAGQGSFQDYALGKLGGDKSQFSCLESLWGKESGWDPNAQNPSSTAYGIPQFLDSTWASTGIAKTSNGYRQIDAGLIYIDSRYGSPCGAWSHSKATGWY